MITNFSKFKVLRKNSKAYVLIKIVVIVFVSLLTFYLNTNIVSSS